MNTELVTIENEQLVTTSVKVAEVFQRRHDHVLTHIRTVIKRLPKNRKADDLFYYHEWKDEQSGQIRKEYVMNRDGFSLLVMGFTGEQALEWKLKYIEAFNSMEAELKSKDLLMPNFNDPATAARAWADQYDARRIAEAEKECLQIELDRSKEYYSIKRVAADNNTSFREFSWSLLKRASAEVGKAVKKIFDANYGTVNAYHADAWKKAYPKTKL